MTDQVIVTTKDGKVRGIKQTTNFMKAEFYAFYGIPYGLSTAGELRYKDPVKVEPWNTIHDGTTEKTPGCTHFSYKEHKIIGSEDCLYTNIYTQKLPYKGGPLKPVILNLPPSGYTLGAPNSDEYGSAEFIMHHDIVYVNVCHRLHILGYLNLNLEECSGNQGIKDVILALQWVKENISVFGGDPGNITLLGSSAGSSMINAMMVSPTAQGLFHKAVLMGLHLMTPVMLHQDTNENYARGIAIDLGYKDDPNDNKKLLSFMKEQKPEDLIREQINFQGAHFQNLAPIFPGSMFLPSLDGGVVLPESPSNLHKSITKIPVMIGFCEIESILGFTRKYRGFTEKNIMQSLRQNHWSWGYKRSNEEMEYIRKKIESYYTNGEPIEKASLRVKIDIQDGILLSDVYDTLIDVMAEEAPVFVYKFRFQGENFGTKSYLCKPMGSVEEEIPGTFHADDYYYWNCYNSSNIQDQATRQMIATFTKLIVTFAKNGNPNHTDLPVTWKPTKPDKPCYLSINNEFEMIDGKLNHEKSEFWDAIVKQFHN